jgi:uncharacterized protein with HEPN domain
MPPEDRDIAYLWDLVQAAREILAFVEDKTFEDYSRDRMLQMATERGLQILGDAARRLSESFRAAHPDIPWSGIIGQRNVVVHDYADLDSTRIWRVLDKDLPELLPQIETLLPKPPQG